MNLLSDAVVALGQEVTELLAEAEGVRIERIVSRNATSPEGFWYDQPSDEWVGVLSGEGTILFDDGERKTLGPGDWTLIPARRRHRVEYTSDPTIWLAVFFPKRR